MKGKLTALMVVLVAASMITLVGVASVADSQSETRTQEWKTAIVVPLTGPLEKPEPVDTNATGLAVFWLSEDMEQMCYMLYVANLTNVTQAHIHMVEEGNETGPPVVWLYPENATQPQLKPGETDGLLAMGTFDASNFIGPMANMTMMDMLDAIENQTVYVNLHTSQNPAGEIRGEFNVMNQSCDSLEQTFMEAMGGMNATGASPMAAPPASPEQMY